MKRGTPEHPKVAELCRLLKIGKAEAVGTLELLWHFAAKFAPQGDIGKYSDRAIADAVGWQRPTGERGVTPECKLSDALVRAGWLDRSPTHRLIVHDWADHADQSVTKRLSRHRLEMYGQSPDKNSLPVPVPVPVPEPEFRASHSPVQAPPKERAPRTPKDWDFPEQGQWFTEWYGIYPKHVAKPAAEKAFRRQIKKRDLCDKAIAAVRSRKGGLSNSDPQFYPHPATWLNQRPWEDDDAPTVQNHQRQIPTFDELHAKGLV